MSGRDVLLFGLTQSESFDQLMRWAETTKDIHSFVPDFHRLQLEHWIWTHRERLQGRVLDVGVQNPRRWLGPEYQTMGLYGCDLTGDLRAIPLAPESLDGMVLTEVLEHCEQPFEAMAEVHRVLKPGALLLVTSPFIWPWHGTQDYKDFWRFTHQGWQLLLKKFTTVSIEPCKWTSEGTELYDLLRRFECFGHQAFTHASTGYLCEAVK